MWWQGAISQASKGPRILCYCSTILAGPGQQPLPSGLKPGGLGGEGNTLGKGEPRKDLMEMSLMSRKRVCFFRDAMYMCSGRTNLNLADSPPGLTLYFLLLKGLPNLRLPLEENDFLAQVPCTPAAFECFLKELAGGLHVPGRCCMALIKVVKIPAGVAWR